jgi:hypothetical protein
VKPTVLDVKEKQETRYCIDEWLRDEQIKQALRLPNVGRIQPHYESRTEPIAVVGYGPSLQDTWEQVRDFKYVISCSGSHKFLVERGVIPSWHVEVDPRPHKVHLIGPPQPETEYLISSTCHKAVFDHLAGFNVKLWHVFDSTEDGRRLLPRGEWAITGGCDVGLRALTIAAFLGFRDLHVFGLDGSARDNRKHAAEHPNAIQKYAPCDYDGVTYFTTPGMLAAAQGLWHELDQLPKVRARFYGEGLIQHMARNYQRGQPVHPSLGDIVAFSEPELISSEYRELNARLHRENLAFGVGGGKHAKTVLKLCERIKTTSVLDYGCGKGYLAKSLDFPIWEYDPAIPGKDETPRPADLVVCTDVLEHIEPERIQFVLDDLRRVTRKVGFFVIHMAAAQKTLPDGRNTHLLQRDRKWWKKQLGKFFQVGQINEVGKELYVVVGPKAGIHSAKGKRYGHSLSQKGAPGTEAQGAGRQAQPG